MLAGLGVRAEPNVEARSAALLVPTTFDNPELKHCGLCPRHCRLRFPSALLRAGCRDFLAADNDVTDLQRVAPEHQTSTHAEPTDRAVTVRIDVTRSQAIVFKQALNAVKSRPPSAVQKTSFNTTANQSLHEFTSPGGLIG